MPETTPQNHDVTPATPKLVWLWQRKPDSTDLEKVLVPGCLVPDGWLPSLQHRYAGGDRVQFTYDAHGNTQYGTVVQDQGRYLAIDGDKPGSAYTIHKSNTCPLDGVPAAPSEPDSITAIQPHPRPVVRRQGHTATAYWNLGEPTPDGWQPRARLHISFQPDAGFIARLDSVDERRNHARHRPLDPIVVHHHPAGRRSHRAARECLRDAIAIVVSAVGHREPAVCVHFVPLLPAPPGT